MYSSVAAGPVSRTDYVYHMCTLCGSVPHTH